MSLASFMAAALLLLLATMELSQQADATVLDRRNLGLDSFGEERQFWQGKEAQEVLRELLAMATERERERSELKAKAASTGALLDRIVALFAERDEFGRGQKHNCFFTPMNCRIAPRHNLSGVIRVPIDEEMRNRIVQKHGHKRKQGRHSRSRYAGFK